MNSPLVSIVIPAYNAQNFIARSLKSALRQTYENIEVIVIDDGSTDKTGEIVRSYQDPRIKYSYQENQWLGAARNAGIRKSKGRYITFLDADDFFLPEKVQRQVDFLEKKPEYDIVYCSVLHFYTERPSRFLKKRVSSYPTGNIFRELLEWPIMNPNAPMFRREVFEKDLMFWDGKEKYPEDWDLFLRIAQAGFKFGFLDEDLAVVEIRDGSLTTTWEAQWIYKKNTIVMFENLFSKMDPRERETIDTKKIINKYKFQLAITHLINDKKREFLEIMDELCSGGAILFLRAALFLVPSFIIKRSLINLWKRKQRLTFYVVPRSNDIFRDISFLLG